MIQDSSAGSCSPSNNMRTQTWNVGELNRRILYVHYVFKDGPQLKANKQTKSVNLSRKKLPVRYTMLKIIICDTST